MTADRPLTWGPAVLFGALALLPDADVIGFAFGVKYGDPLGHRGASHSLLAAAVVAAVAALLCWALKRPGPLSWFLWVFAVVGSHGLLDTLTTGGKGVALLWPFSETRFFAPWRPIPVAPIGAGLLSLRGLHVMAVEALLFAPFWVYALWPQRWRRRAR